VRLPIKIETLDICPTHTELRENALQLAVRESAHAASHLGRSLVLLPSAIL